ncbi:DUF1697 domain-containing protein [Pseudonocardia asaccharolytica]|uniref:DUF1697 domain-containing protein n=1 Tax=Pseudonocardia asaccharolytica DSM 44247 = NBRC 16224 TaxID=1123024 RepID=A0A511CW18_9PSEU|nr:DUF1697 domain-containing protein [Pseudonocardia asaccharolytica]GEL16775.1 hypothetical protein PA7_06120 [Pseudonocardia asaccharolytica DSM 44247 = NBRC 16224]
MPSYAVLLRGVNVGGKTIAMADLRALLSDLGFDAVRTHLRSGNAVFRTADTPPGELAARIETALTERLGMDVRCLVRTRDEMNAVIAGDPLAGVADNGSRRMALFLSADPDPALKAAHDPTALDPERIHLGRRVIYQWCPDGFLQAPDVSAFVMKHWKLVVTGRNWNTVTKLAALLDAG